MGGKKATVSDPGKLLLGMEPSLREGKFFFASVGEDQMMNLANYLDYISGIFRESEGLSVIFSEDIREEMSGLSDSDVVGPFALISLGVNSDLMAVGFLARLSAALAAEGISVNAVSAYHHDHLFVPYPEKEAAMEALRKLAEGGR